MNIRDKRFYEMSFPKERDAITGLPSIKRSILEVSSDGDIIVLDLDDTIFPSPSFDDPHPSGYHVLGRHGEYRLTNDGILYEQVEELNQEDTVLLWNGGYRQVLATRYKPVKQLSPLDSRIFSPYVLSDDGRHVITSGRESMLDVGGRLGPLQDKSSYYDLKASTVYGGVVYDRPHNAEQYYSTILAKASQN